jgi:hypothetical protein
LVFPLIDLELVLARVAREELASGLADQDHHSGAANANIN